MDTERSHCVCHHLTIYDSVDTTSVFGDESPRLSKAIRRFGKHFSSHFQQ
jgi:hypothetical protein